MKKSRIFEMPYGKHISESVFALPGSEIWKIPREWQRWSTPLGVEYAVVRATDSIPSSVEYRSCSFLKVLQNLRTVDAKRLHTFVCELY